MLWMRSSFYDPKKGVMTTVIPEDGLRDEIHVSADLTRRQFGRLVDVEIFEWENDLISASKEAERRSRERLTDEAHCKYTLLDFLIANFVKVPPTTIIRTTIRAPLSTAEVKKIAIEAAKSPRYKGHIALLFSETGDTVVLAQGTVVVKDA